MLMRIMEKCDSLWFRKHSQSINSTVLGKLVPISPRERLRDDRLYVAETQKLEMQVPSVGGIRKAATEGSMRDTQRESSKMNHTDKNNQLSRGG